MTAPQITEQDVVAMEQQRLAAMERNDAKAISEMVHSECIYTHSPGDRDTRDSYIKKCQSGNIQYNRLSCDIEKVIIRGEVAIAFGTMNGDAMVGGSPRKLVNCYTAIWTPEGDDWRLIGFQPTPIRS